MAAEPKPLFFDYVSRTAVVAPSGNGKTEFLLNLIKHREYFPEDVSGVWWLNAKGIDVGKEGDRFDHLLKDPSFYHIVPGGTKFSAFFMSPDEEAKNGIIIVDDFYTEGGLTKEERTPIELALKRQVNHQNWIYFMTQQETFSENIKSSNREAYNTFAIVSRSHDIDKMNMYLKKAIHKDSKEALLWGKIIRQVVDEYGYVSEPSEGFTTIVKRHTGAGRDPVEWWGVRNKDGQSYYYADTSAGDYLSLPAHM